MHYDYFERLHREEQRQRDNRMLEAALRTAQRSTPTYKVRIALGSLLVQAGTAIAGK